MHIHIFHYVYASCISLDLLELNFIRINCLLEVYVGLILSSLRKNSIESSLSRRVLEGVLKVG